MAKVTRIGFTLFWWDKTLANRSFQSFGEENVGEFTIANVSYFNLGKILAYDVCFTKFISFPLPKFCAIYIRGSNIRK